MNVPAGTFQACKVITRLQQSSDLGGRMPDAYNIRWSAVGSGTTLKSESNSFLIELLSATINGEPVQ